MKVVDWGMENT